MSKARPLDTRIIRGEPVSQAVYGSKSHAAVRQVKHAIPIFQFLSPFFFLGWVARSCLINGSKGVQLVQ